MIISLLLLLRIGEADADGLDELRRRAVVGVIHFDRPLLFSRHRIGYER
jgi:hypothetical protein